MIQNNIMKIKILESSGWYKHFVDSEFEVDQYVVDDYLGIHIEDTGWIYRHHCVITELPESFCVKRCHDDKEKWEKYIQWLNKTYNHIFNGCLRIYYGYLNECGSFSDDEPFGMEIHIDDMIKHIDYMERHMNGGEQFHKESQLIAKMDKIIKQGEFDLTTVEGRLAYAKKHYPIGTKYKPLSNFGGAEVNSINAEFEPRIWVSARGINNGIEVSKMGLIYHGVTNKWAEIIKEEEFDLTTNEGRLAYARKYYPIGTKYVPLCDSGQAYDGIEISEYKPRIWVNDRDSTNGIEVGRVGLIYHEKSNKWAEIIKEETNMNTQKLSRQGLKEIHSIACSSWKETLEQFGRRNPLEDYIELSQKEIDIMFDACTKEQLPIVSKYLKQDDGSVDIMKFKGQIYDNDGRAVIEKRYYGEYAHKSLLLEDVYNWEIKKDSKGKLCLIPTKKK